MKRPEMQRKFSALVNMLKNFTTYDEGIKYRKMEIHFFTVSLILNLQKDMVDELMCRH